MLPLVAMQVQLYVIFQCQGEKLFGFHAFCHKKILTSIPGPNLLSNRARRLSFCRMSVSGRKLELRFKIVRWNTVGSVILFFRERFRFFDYTF
jgi:hypothetical protein